jgi:alpha-ketoglutarate-dependent taurine dioxygenase
MSITIYPVTPRFVAEAGDVDLTRLGAVEVAAIKQAFWKYAVLVFPEQDLTPDQHLAFAGKFGPVEVDRVLDPKASPHRLSMSFADIWRAKDLVMWDNRCTLHRGTDYDDLRWVRDMHRATVSDVANTCEQAGIAVPA